MLQESGAIGWCLPSLLEFPLDPVANGLRPTKWSLSRPSFRGTVPLVFLSTVADVIFPEVVSFPLRQRLALNGTFEDSILPAPNVSDEKEDWGVIVDAGAEEEDLLQFDGICNENVS